LAGGVFRHYEEAHADAVCAIAAEAIGGACATAAAAAGSGVGLGRGSGSGSGNGAAKSDVWSARVPGGAVALDTGISSGKTE